MKLKKFEGNPILSPLETNDWESLVTCNPGVIYDNGVFYMLYRSWMETRYSMSAVVI